MKNKDIVERLREWAATLWDRELDEEDKDALFDDLTQAADEIESLRAQREYDREAFEKILDIKVEELEAERKKHEWISVKDRLPEDALSKLITVEVNDNAKWVEKGFFGVERKWFAYGWTDIEEIKEPYIVTHWMPFPDPPKGEEEAKP